jgi:hypothetical protein
MTKIVVTNELTGETVDRELTAEETAQREKDLAKFAQIETEKANRQALKTATLAKLGLTADEVAALLS